MNFEELIWLFSSNTHSRGIVRLNIAEGALLYRYCKKCSDGVLLEIGRKHGGSTVIMAAALDDGSLCSIDIVMHDDVAENMADINKDVEYITSDSKDVGWDRPIDLVFIDGDHSYKGVKNDIKVFTPHVVEGGYAVFHDVIGKKPILQPLLDGMLNNGWTSVDQADSMVVLQKDRSND